MIIVNIIVIVVVNNSGRNSFYYAVTWKELLQQFACKSFLFSSFIISCLNFNQLPVKFDLV